MKNLLYVSNLRQGKQTKFFIENDRKQRSFILSENGYMPIDGLNDL